METTIENARQVAFKAEREAAWETFMAARARFNARRDEAIAAAEAEYGAACEAAHARIWPTTPTTEVKS